MILKLRISLFHNENACVKHNHEILQIIRPVNGAIFLNF